jgi:hypothetical protein
MHHTIVALELTGGFLRGVRLEFADGLNCIIGGRGTGKTTIIELVRYALGLMPDSRVSPARAKAVAGLVQSNLGNGKIRLHVETKHGMRYVAERPWNDSGDVDDPEPDLGFGEAGPGVSRPVHSGSPGLPSGVVVSVYTFATSSAS